MYGYIYKFTCIPTNRIYVGQHRGESFDEAYWGSGKIWKRVLSKYSLDEIRREILEWCETKDDLAEREIYWISTLDSCNPKIGYNISAGGYNPRMIGPANPMFGKTHSEEARKKISDHHKGLKRSDEFKKTRSDYMKGRHWYNNSIEEHYYNDDEVPEGYVRGRLKKSEKILSEIQLIKKPIRDLLGDDYDKLPWRVFNNGKLEIQCPICPEGFTEGRLPDHAKALYRTRKGRKLTDEHKAKISLKSRGENNGMYGVHRYGKDAPGWGNKCSDARKEKIRAALKGRIKITDGVIIKNIKIEDLEDYIKKGFYRVKKV